MVTFLAPSLQLPLSYNYTFGIEHAPLYIIAQSLVALSIYILTKIITLASVDPKSQTRTCGCNDPRPCASTSPRNASTGPKMPGWAESAATPSVHHLVSSFRLGPLSHRRCATVWPHAQKMDEEPAHHQLKDEGLADGVAGQPLHHLAVGR